MTTSCPPALPLRKLKELALAGALLASFTTPAHAFLTELVVGLTSVTNNLIDSTESVTNNTVNTASTTMLSLSSNPGKMADRIGVMADRIGFMADRIVTTEGIMAGLAHKIIDSSQSRAAPQQYALAYSPAYSPAYVPTYAPAQPVRGNPYMAANPAPAVAHYGYATLPDNSRYSASQMIYGVSGATYTAARPAASTAAVTVATTPAAAGTQAGYRSDFGFAARPAVHWSTPQATQPNQQIASNSCGFSYGVPRSC